MPINPEGKPSWRPQHDIGRSHRISLNSRLPYKPKGKQAAATHVNQTARPEVTADASSGGQPNMITDDTRLHLPGSPEAALDKVESEAAARGLKSSFTDRLFDMHRRPDGSIDWDGVAQNTVYVPQITKVEPALPESTETRLGGILPGVKLVD